MTKIKTARGKRVTTAPIYVQLDAVDMREWWLTDEAGKEIKDLPSFTTYSEAQLFVSQKNYVLTGLTVRARDVVNRFFRSFENA